MAQLSAGEFREVVRSGYDNGKYDEQFRSGPLGAFDKERLDSFFDVASQKTPHPTTVDLGCGTGQPYDQYLVERGCQLTGVDFSQRHIQLARKALPGVQFDCADMTTVDFTPNSLDGVLCLYSLFHLPRSEHKEMIRKVSQWLRPEGAFLVVMGTNDDEQFVTDDFVGAAMAWSSFAPQVSETLLTECGLKIVDRKFEGNPGDDEHHYWLLCSKAVA